MSFFVIMSKLRQMNVIALFLDVKNNIDSNKQNQIKNFIIPNKNKNVFNQKNGK